MNEFEERMLKKQNSIFEFYENEIKALKEKVARTNNEIAQSIDIKEIANEAKRGNEKLSKEMEKLTKDLDSNMKYTKQIAERTENNSKSNDLKEVKAKYE